MHSAVDEHERDGFHLGPIKEFKSEFEFADDKWLELPERGSDDSSKHISEMFSADFERF